MQTDQKRQHKKISQELLFKLRQLATQCQDIEWKVDNKVLVIKQNEHADKKVQDILGMNIKTLYKMLKMCGAKVVNKQNITVVKLPQKQPDFNISQRILNKNTQPNNSVFDNRRLHINDQVSLEMNLKKNELELYHIEYENMIREQFMKSLTQNVNQCNQICDKSVLQILINYKKKGLSQQQILSVLTQIRDRIFQNQRDLDQCIQNLRIKISTLVSQPAGIKKQVQQNEKQEENEEDVKDKYEELRDE